ncbi:hypothetical protein B0H19DRAFT_1275914 [Mycena capillaripes]|nr:hypothetical protein B0H19DRAFT_1275914 [Mycena capillaripes]
MQSLNSEIYANSLPTDALNTAPAQFLLRIPTNTDLLRTEPFWLSHLISPPGDTKTARRASTQYLTNRTAKFVVKEKKISAVRLGDSYHWAFANSPRIPRQSKFKRHGRTSISAPLLNLWAGNKLTNIVYLKQPAGVGYPQEISGLLMNSRDATRGFIGVWKNFVDAFGLHARKVVLAGYLVPFIADAMLNVNDAGHFNVTEMFMVDPIIGDKTTAQHVPHPAMTRNFPHLSPFTALTRVLNRQNSEAR